MGILLSVRCLANGILEIIPRCGRVYRAAAYAGQNYRFRLPPNRYVVRLSGETSASLTLDLRCPCQSCVYVTLPLQANPGNAIQSFTLSDATYNLPINGVLLFTPANEKTRTNPVYKKARLFRAL